MTMNNKFDFIKKYLEINGEGGAISTYGSGFVKVETTRVCDLASDRWFAGDMSFVKDLMFPYKNKKHYRFERDYETIAIVKSILRNKGWFLESQEVYSVLGEYDEDSYYGEQYEYIFKHKKTGVKITVISDSVDPIEVFKEHFKYVF